MSAREPITPTLPLGINIGKNFDTPLEHAAKDYVSCLRKVYGLASYVTVNISSPNTKGLRDLQGSDHLDALLSTLAQERVALTGRYGRRVPIALKRAGAEPGSSKFSAENYA